MEYRVEIALGTNLDDIFKHQKDLALALASPTGWVKIEAPIPGRSLVGITVPMRVNDTFSKAQTMIGGLFILLGKWLERFGYIIIYGRVRL